MTKKWITFCLITAALLLIPSVAGAASSLGVAWTPIGWDPYTVPGVDWIGVFSESHVQAEDYTGSDGYSMAVPDSYSEAFVPLPEAMAVADTGYYGLASVESGCMVIPSPGTVASAWADATQQWEFYAVTNTLFEAQIPWEIDQFLSTEWTGEYATVTAALEITLLDVAGGVIATDSVVFNETVTDGDDFSWVYNGILTITHPLFIGQFGTFEIAASVSAGAESVSVIPVPGAILLGSLGIGIVGWLKRRRLL